jgi:hypothetical protein
MRAATFDADGRAGYLRRDRGQALAARLGSGGRT